MEKEFVPYGEIQLLIQNVLKNDSYEQVLLNLTNDVIQKVNKSDTPEVEEYQIQILSDALKSCDLKDEQKPIVNMLLGRLKAAM